MCAVLFMPLSPSSHLLLVFLSGISAGPRQLATGAWRQSEGAGVGMEEPGDPPAGSDSALSPMDDCPSARKRSASAADFLGTGAPHPLPSLPPSTVLAQKPPEREAFHLPLPKLGFKRRGFGVLGIHFLASAALTHSRLTMNPTPGTSDVRV